MLNDTRAVASPNRSQHSALFLKGRMRWRGHLGWKGILTFHLWNPAYPLTPPLSNSAMFRVCPFGPFPVAVGSLRRECQRRGVNKGAHLARAPPLEKKPHKPIDPSNIF